jgi:ectoine hydroxylase-related dioxygenase (phytanoyl-CoA dioxygenase family)
MRDSFQSQGYVIAEDCFPRLYLSRVAEVLWTVLAKGTDDEDLSLEALIQKREIEDHRKVFEAALSVGSSLAATELVGRSQLISIAAELYDVSPKHLHAMPLHVAIQMPHVTTWDYEWHQESAFYPWVPDILNVWFPLTHPSRVESGTMAVIPGSHGAGKRQAHTRDAQSFIQIIPEMEAGEEERAIPMLTEPGNAVLFHADMLHKSLPNMGMVPRLTGVLRIVNHKSMKRWKPLIKALGYVEA